MECIFIPFKGNLRLFSEAYALCGRFANPLPLVVHTLSGTYP